MYFIPKSPNTMENIEKLYWIDKYFSQHATRWFHREEISKPK